MSTFSYRGPSMDIQAQEDELKHLEEERDLNTRIARGEVDPNDPTIPPRDTGRPLSTEEETYKKRYGDLRTYAQEKDKQYQNEIARLKDQLEQATTQQFKLPKTEAEIAQFQKEYPEAFAIFSTIATVEVQKRSKELDKLKQVVEADKAKAARDNAIAELSRLHPDWNDIRQSQDFHDWAAAQPDWVQQALYHNEFDGRAAARAVDLYKIDAGITKPKSSPKSDTRKAATAVTPGRTNPAPTTDLNGAKYSESMVKSMSDREYEKHAEAIDEAIRTGRFVYDISGGAR